MLHFESKSFPLSVLLELLNLRGGSWFFIFIYHSLASYFQGVMIKYLNPLNRGGAPMVSFLKLSSYTPS